MFFTVLFHLLPTDGHSLPRDKNPTAETSIASCYTTTGRYRRPLRSSAGISPSRAIPSTVMTSSTFRSAIQARLSCNHTVPFVLPSPSSTVGPTLGPSQGVVGSVVTRIRTPHAISTEGSSFTHGSSSFTHTRSPVARQTSPLGGGQVTGNSLRMTQSQQVRSAPVSRQVSKETFTSLSVPVEGNSFPASVVRSPQCSSARARFRNISPAIQEIDGSEPCNTVILSSLSIGDHITDVLERVKNRQSSPGTAEAATGTTRTGSGFVFPTSIEHSNDPVLPNHVLVRNPSSVAQGIGSSGGLAVSSAMPASSTMSSSMMSPLSVMQSSASVPSFTHHQQYVAPVHAAHSEGAHLAAHLSRSPMHRAGTVLKAGVAFQSGMIQGAHKMASGALATGTSASSISRSLQAGGSAPSSSRNLATRRESPSPTGPSAISPTASSPNAILDDDGLLTVFTAAGMTTYGEVTRLASIASSAIGNAVASLGNPTGGADEISIPATTSMSGAQDHGVVRDLQEDQQGFRDVQGGTFSGARANSVSHRVPQSKEPDNVVETPGNLVRINTRPADIIRDENITNHTISAAARNAFDSSSARKPPTIPGHPKLGASGTTHNIGAVPGTGATYIAPIAGSPDGVSRSGASSPNLFIAGGGFRSPSTTDEGRYLDARLTDTDIRTTRELKRDGSKASNASSEFRFQVGRQASLNDLLFSGTRKYDGMCSAKVVHGTSNGSTSRSPSSEGGAAAAPVAAVTSAAVPSAPAVTPVSPSLSAVGMPTVLKWYYTPRSGASPTRSGDSSPTGSSTRRTQLFATPAQGGVGLGGMPTVKFSPLTRMRSVPGATVPSVLSTLRTSSYSPRDRKASRNESSTTATSYGFSPPREAITTPSTPVVTTSSGVTVPNRMQAMTKRMQAPSNAVETLGIVDAPSSNQARGSSARVVSPLQRTTGVGVPPSAAHAALSSKKLETTSQKDSTVSKATMVPKATIPVFNGANRDLTKAHPYSGSRATGSGSCGLYDMNLFTYRRLFQLLSGDIIERNNLRSSDLSGSDISITNPRSVDFFVDSTSQFQDLRTISTPEGDAQYSRQRTGQSQGTEEQLFKSRIVGEYEDSMSMQVDPSHRMEESTTMQVDQGSRADGRMEFSMQVDGEKQMSAGMQSDKSHGHFLATAIANKRLSNRESIEQFLAYVAYQSDIHPMAFLEGFQSRGAPNRSAKASTEYRPIHTYTENVYHPDDNPDTGGGNDFENCLKSFGDLRLSDEVLDPNSLSGKPKSLSECGRDCSFPGLANSSQGSLGVPQDTSLPQGGGGGSLICGGPPTSHGDAPFSTPLTESKRLSIDNLYAMDGSERFRWTVVESQSVSNDMDFDSLAFSSEDTFSEDITPSHGTPPNISSKTINSNINPGSAPESISNAMESGLESSSRTLCPYYDDQSFFETPAGGCRTLSPASAQTMNPAHQRTVSSPTNLPATQYSMNPSSTDKIRTYELHLDLYERPEEWLSEDSFLPQKKTHLTDSQSSLETLETEPPVSARLSSNFADVPPMGYSPRVIVADGISGGGKPASSSTASQMIMRSGQGMIGMPPSPVVAVATTHATPLATVVGIGQSPPGQTDRQTRDRQVTLPPVRTGNGSFPAGKEPGSPAVSDVTIDWNQQGSRHDALFGRSMPSSTAEGSTGLSNSLGAFDGYGMSLAVDALAKTINHPAKTIKITADGSVKIITWERSQPRFRRSSSETTILTRRSSETTIGHPDGVLPGNADTGSLPPAKNYIEPSLSSDHVKTLLPKPIEKVYPIWKRGDFVKSDNDFCSFMEDWERFLSLTSGVQKFGSKKFRQPDVFQSKRHGTYTGLNSTQDGITLSLEDINFSGERSSTDIISVGSLFGSQVALSVPSRDPMEGSFPSLDGNHHGSSKRLSDSSKRLSGSEKTLRGPSRKTVSLRDESGTDFDAEGLTNSVLLSLVDPFKSYRPCQMSALETYAKSLDSRLEEGVALNEGVGYYEVGGGNGYYEVGGGNGYYEVGGGIGYYGDEKQEDTVEPCEEDKMSTASHDSDGSQHSYHTNPEAVLMVVGSSLSPLREELTPQSTNSDGAKSFHTEYDPTDLVPDVRYLPPDTRVPYPSTLHARHDTYFNREHGGTVLSGRTEFNRQISVGSLAGSDVQTIIGDDTRVVEEIDRTQIAAMESRIGAMQSGNEAMQTGKIQIPSIPNRNANTDDEDTMAILDCGGDTMASVDCVGVIRPTPRGLEPLQPTFQPFPLEEYRKQHAAAAAAGNQDFFNSPQTSRSFLTVHKH